MGQREIVIKESVANAIAEIAWFIESKGMVLTAEKFSDDVYDFIARIADARRRYAVCRDPERALVGYRCIAYKRKYTLVFLETDEEVLICEFLLSKNIHW